MIRYDRPLRPIASRLTPLDRPAASQRHGFNNLRGLLRRRLIRIVILLGAIGAITTAAADVGAVSHKEKKALSLTSKAKAAYQAANYSEAASLFQQAYAQVPEPTLLFNAARAYQKGRYLREALSLFRLYLTLATYDDAETRAGRVEAKKYSADIRRQLQAISAAHTRSHQTAGAAAHGGAPHTAAGTTPTTQSSTTQPSTTAPTTSAIRGGQPRPSSPAAGPPPAVRAPPAAPRLGSQKPVRRPGLFTRVSSQGWTEREIAAVSLLGGGATVLLTGLILRAVASSTLSDLDTDLARGRQTRNGVTFYPGITQSAVQESIDRSDGYRFGGNMLIGLGIVAAGVGTWLWLGRSLDDDGRLTWAPSLTNNSVGWVLQGRF